MELLLDTDYIERKLREIHIFIISLSLSLSLNRPSCEWKINHQYSFSLELIQIVGVFVCVCEDVSVVFVSHFLCIEKKNRNKWTSIMIIAISLIKKHNVGDDILSF